MLNIQNNFRKNESVKNGEISANICGMSGIRMNKTEDDTRVYFKKSAKMYLSLDRYLDRIFNISIEVLM